MIVYNIVVGLLYKMSSIAKCIWELSWPAQIVLILCVLSITINLVWLKLALRWWTSTQPQPQAQTPPPQRNILTRIITSCTILQPCLHNLTINKISLILCIQIWMYVLITTNTLSKSMGDGKNGVAMWINGYGSVVGYFGWIGIAIGGIDLGARYWWVRGLKNAQMQSQIQPQTQPQTQPPIQPQIQQIQPQILTSPTIYYLILGISSTALQILLVHNILTSTSTSPTNFSNFPQTSHKLQHSSICFLILLILHHLYVAAIGLIIWGYCTITGLDVADGEIWMYVVGGRVSGGRESGRVDALEESRENLGNLTERNNVDQLIFMENIEMFTAEKQKVTGNGSQYSAMRSRRKKQIFSLNNKSTYLTQNHRTNNQTTIKRRKYGSYNELTHSSSIKGSSSNNKRKKSIFTQSEPTISQSNSNQCKLIKIKIEPKDLFEDNILSNIENKVEEREDRKKIRRSQDQLKIVNYDENDREDISIVDLSEYVVKDLGFAQVSQVYKEPVLMNFKKKNLPSLKKVNPIVSQENGYYIRRKRSKAPNISQQNQAEGATFCLQELKKQ